MFIVRAYKNYRNYRRVLNELEGMSDRDLHDIGISRADVPAVARQAYPKIR